MRRASLLACSLAIASVAFAQDVRRATPIQRSAGRCARPDCRVAWSHTIGRGVRAEVRDVEQGRDNAIVLVVNRRGTRFSHEIARSGTVCGGFSEIIQVASLERVELHDFAGGPLPEIFVDYRFTVSAESTVTQRQTVVCSVEGASPSCLGSYVAGDRSTPRTFPARGTIRIGPSTFQVVFP